MKLHRNLVFAVVDALGFIFNEGEYADKVVQKVLKYDKRWGARDRGFIAETTYDMVRWKRLYSEIGEIKAPYTRPKLFRMFAVWAVLKGIKLPDWKQIEPTPERRIKGKFDELSKIRKYRESVPDWLDLLGEKALGDALWTKELAALNEQASVILRTNTLKTTKDKLRDNLTELGIYTDSIKGHPQALKLEQRANVFTTEAFDSGWFEVQDASSQLVAEALDVKPGQRVVDCCAGAGGKTLHLAALMENKGQLIAMDIYANKLKELQRRAKRAGAFNIEPRHISSTKVIKKLHEKADRVLIDAPCSGLGVLRRNPDAKWKLQESFLEKITQTQRDILQDYSKMVKDGGKMVYATCSILPQENSQQVAHFLKSEAGANFTLTREQKVYASKSGFDGFYIALLEKKVTTTQENTPKAKAVQLEAKTTETGTEVATVAVKKKTTKPKAAKAEATKATPEKAASKTPKAKTAETETEVAAVGVKKTTTKPKAAKAEATKAAPEKAASKTPKAKTTTKAASKTAEDKTPKAKTTTKAASKTPKAKTTAKASPKTAVKTTTKAAPKTAAKTTKSKVSEEVVKKPVTKVKKVTKE
ncbi:MAG: RsmB/NOP family class I SAM-dependent RNA methyltransferase [Flavobacteriaceae bacterium]|nr:RsmB/NOP family class I SAM-dependent RNA methyltransferase [Flavobacteriaceae bacterium]